MQNDGMNFLERKNGKFIHADKKKQGWSDFHDFNFYFFFMFIDISFIPFGDC